MELVQIYESLCDVTRLRLVQALVPGPLCVCHFQAVLRESQVKISKHLAYLRTRGLVECRRQGNWMIYALPAKPSAALQANLACLGECAAHMPVLARDRARLAKLAAKFEAEGPCGCGPAGPGGRRSRRLPAR